MKIKKLSQENNSTSAVAERKKKTASNLKIDKSRKKKIKIMKSKLSAYLLWFFLGSMGAHKFYLNKTGMGILYFLTFGIFGIGLLIDLFTLGGQVDTYNALYGRQFGSLNQNISNDNNIVINTPGNDSKESNSISERLIELHDLKEKGILSEEEYANQKTKVLE